ncbi:MAG: carboxypeptidase regulatory-like domain-containing protein [Candidatus Hydrogenedentes bacterium]|nr:carboxypeptidase regulatory-like domain-containing protein [Candidatus Hydrogenedentota bacterium]
MKSSLRLLAIILAFVVAGAVVWKVLGSRGAQPEQGTENQAQSANAHSSEPGAQTSSGKDSTAARLAANFAQKEQRGKQSGATKDKTTSSTTGSGTIAGTVKSKATGQLVEGAKIQIALRPSGPTDGVPVDRPQWDAVTDAKGEFAVAQLPKGYFSVLAIKDDTAGYATTYLDDDEGAAEISVTLRPAGALSGRVLTESGAPIENAVVFAVPLRASAKENSAIDRDVLGPSPAHVKSDTQGAFTLGPLPEGPWMLAAKADGYTYRESDVLPIGSADVVLTLTKGVIIRCVVTQADSGQPASKVDVTLGTSEYSSNVRTKPTDDSGAVEFAGVGDGEYTLSARSDTYVMSGEPVTFAVSDETDPGEQHLKVITGGSIAGHVLDADTKQPIANALLSAESDEYRSTSHEGRSASDGSYCIKGLSTGLYELACSKAPGYMSVTRLEGKVVSVNAGQAVGEMDIALKRGLSIQGVVVDVAGNPIGHAKVSGEGDSPDFDELLNDAITDSAGAFTLDGFAPNSRVSLDVTKKGYAQEPTEPVTLSDKEAVGVRIVLGVGATISGTVVDAEGKPDPDAYVWARLAGSPRSARIRGTVDDEGQFVIDGLAPGTYGLGTQFAMSGAGEPVQVAKGQNVSGIRLVADRENSYEGAYGSHGTLTISGRVTNRKGEPIRDAQVMAMMSGDGFGTGHAETDKEGGYTVSGLAEGGYKVSVSASRYSSPDSIEIAAGSSGVNFTMDLPAKVSGQVVDAVTSQPITSFQIAQQDASDDSDGVDSMFSWMSYMRRSRQFVTFSDPEGRFQLDRVELKNSVLVAQAAGHSPARFPVTGLRPGETKQGIVIRMDSGASVSGVVKDSKGNPIAGAVVYAGAQAEIEDRIGETPNASTDQTGAFHLDSLAPGELHLKVTHREYAAKSASVIAQSGQVTPVEIILTTGGMVSGTVRRGGKPVPGLLVSAFSMSEGEMGDSRDATTDANGTYTLAGLTPGEAHVSVQLHSSFDVSSAMSFRSKSQTVTVEADKVTAADFDLTTGTAVVEGKITSDGQPARMAMVAVLPSGADAATPQTLGENMMEAASMTGADGSFRIEGLTAGKITLMVTVIGGLGQAEGSGSSDVAVVSGMNSRTVTVQTVDGQTTHQDIELSGGSKVSGTVSGLSAGETAMVFALRGDVDLSGTNLFTAMAHVDKYAGMATSDVEGVYTVKGLEPGRYTIAAMAVNAKTGPDPAHPRFTTGGVTVPADGEAKLDLKIP